MNILVFTCIGGDVVCALAGLSAAFLILSGRLPLTADFYFLEILRAALFVLVLALCSSLAEMYNLNKTFAGHDIAVRVVFAVFPASIILFSFNFLASPAGFEGRILILSMAAFALFQYIWQVCFRTWAKTSGFAKRLLILGEGPLADQIGKLISSPANAYVLAGYLNCSGEPPIVPYNSVAADKDNLLEAVRRERAHGIIVSLPEMKGVFPLESMLSCKLSGIEVVDAPSFYERMTGKLLLEHINPSWIIFSRGFRLRCLPRLVKRIIDVTVALTGLVLLLPFMLIIAALIKLDSPGPVLFRQQRIGEGDAAFTLFKFRTMLQGAENISGAVWAGENDPRVTGMGRFLRNRHIDELPQLINVLMGDMSLVGPRPERPEFIIWLKKMIPYYGERHYVKPGITGWAQVSYPYGASVEDSLEKLRYDMYYIKNWSLAFDLVIFMETVKVVILGKGGR